MESIRFGQAAQADNFRVIAVAAPLVTLTELKQHLGIYEDDFDGMLSNVIIPASTEIVSNIMGEFATATTVEAYYRNLGTTSVLPHNHVASVSSVQFRNVNHRLVTLVADTDYIFDTTSRPASITLIRDDVDVELSDRFTNPVTITYTADIAESVFDVVAIVQATLMICSDLWNNRSNQTNAYSRASVTAERILAPLKRVSI